MNYQIEELTVEQVIRKYSNTIYRLAFAKTGNKFDADEIYQEVCLRYVKSLPKFKDENHRKAWFIKVTVNCAKKFKMSLWNKRTEGLDDNQNVVLEQSNDYELYYELKKLPEKYREVIHLYYYEDMSIEEISKALGRKCSTVRTQLTRARGLLKNFMKEEDYV